MVCVSNQAGYDIAARCPVWAPPLRGGATTAQQDLPTPIAFNRRLIDGRGAPGWFSLGDESERHGAIKLNPCSIALLRAPARCDIGVPIAPCSFASSPSENQPGAPRPSMSLRLKCNRRCEILAAHRSSAPAKGGAQPGTVLLCHIRACWTHRPCRPP